MDDHWYEAFMNHVGIQPPPAAVEQDILSDLSSVPEVSSDTSEETMPSMPYLPYVSEIVSCGKDKYKPVSVSKDKIEVAVADSEFEVGVSDSSIFTTTPRFLELWSDPKMVRNVALVGHLHHGKTVFMDMLVEQSHVVSTFDENNGKHIRFTDTRKDEQEREMSIKAVPMSIVLQGSNSFESYVCNIMDTPGHVDFSDEMSAALRLADGVVLIVDVAEGVMLNTKRGIHHAIQEHLPIVVVINKVDRLITELQLSLEDAYLKIEHTIQVLNNHITTGAGNHHQIIDPTAGNICFASATGGWCFTLQSFARLYLQRTGSPPLDDPQEFGTHLWGNENYDPQEFGTHLWGNEYYDPATKVFSNEEQHATGMKRSFVHFILQPLYDIYMHVIIKEDKESLETTLTNLGLTLDYNLNGRVLLRSACNLVFGTTNGFADILIHHIPCAEDAASRKIDRIFTGPTNTALFTAMKKCDPDGPLAVDVVKLYPALNSRSFNAFGRVYSGIIKCLSPAVVRSHDYLRAADDDDDDDSQNVTMLWVYQARYKIPINMAKAGSWVLIEGFHPSISTPVALFDPANVGELDAFRPLHFNTLPVLKFMIKPLKNSVDLYSLTNAIMSYPLAILEEENGKFMITGTGELYMDCLLKDLKERYVNKKGVKVEGPYFSFRETAVESSCIKCFARTPDGRNKITMVVEPLTRGRADEIYSWDPLEYLQILGPDEEEVDKSLNDTVALEVKESLSDMLEPSLNGVDIAIRDGPLCEEHIRDVKLKVTNAEIEGELDLPTITRATSSAFVMSKPRLMEAMYYAEIQTPLCYVSAIKELLSKRRGNILADDPEQGTPFHTLKAYLPVTESVGLATELEKDTEGHAIGHLTFDHWAIVPGDPLGAPVADNLARKFTRETRVRKGLNETNDFVDDDFAIEISVAKQTDES